MVTSTLQITLPYPPEQVWQVVTDLSDTAWRSDIARVERTGPGAFVEYTPAGVATRFTVTAQEPCRRWAFRLENSSLRGRAAAVWAPPEPGGRGAGVRGGAAGGISAEAVSPDHRLDSAGKRDGAQMVFDQ